MNAARVHAARPGAIRARSRRRRRDAAGRALMGESARRSARQTQVRVCSAAALAGLCCLPLVRLQGGAPVHGVLCAALQAACLAAAALGTSAVCLALVRCLRGK